MFEYQTPKFRNLLSNQNFRWFNQLIKIPNFFSMVVGKLSFIITLLVRLIPNSKYKIWNLELALLDIKIGVLH